MFKRCSAEQALRKEYDSNSLLWNLIGASNFCMTHVLNMEYYLLGVSPHPLLVSEILICSFFYPKKKCILNDFLMGKARVMGVDGAENHNL